MRCFFQSTVIFLLFSIACNTDPPKQNINTPKPTVLFNYIFKGDKHILIVWLSLPYSVESAQRAGSSEHP